MLANFSQARYLIKIMENTLMMNYKTHQKLIFVLVLQAYPEKHMEAPSLDSDIHFLNKEN